MPGYSTTIRNSRLAVIRDACDAGAGPGRLLFYAGTKPATGGSVAGNTLLGTVTMAEPCGTVANAQLTFGSTVRDNAADTNGTISFVRAVDSDNNFVADFTVSATGGGGEVQLPTLTVVQDQPIEISSAVISEGNA